MVWLAETGMSADAACKKLMELKEDLKEESKIDSAILTLNKYKVAQRKAYKKLEEEEIKSVSLVWDFNLVE